MEKSIITSLGQAISVLIQAVEKAQTKGVYGFKDSSLIFEALEFINNVNKNSQQKEELITEKES